MRGQIGLLLLLHQFLARLYTGILFQHGQGKERIASALFDEMARQVKIGRMLRDLVQPQQRDLDLLVAGRVCRSLAAEIVHDAVGGAAGDVEQVGPSRGFVVRDACFDQMPVAVQFVLDLQVRPARIWEVDLVVGEEVAVGRLSAGQEGDETLHARSQFIVWGGAVDAGGRVQPFVRVRVGEEPALAEAVRLPRGDAEIFDATRSLELIPLMKDGAARVDVETFAPETVGDAGGHDFKTLFPPSPQRAQRNSLKSSRPWRAWR